MSDPVILHKGFQFRLLPTGAQENLFWQYAGACRWVYNHMLAQRRATYKATGKALSTQEQIKQLPVLKRQSETVWLGTIHSQVLQEAVWNLDAAFARFFRKEAGYPRFKKRHGRKQSFSYPQGVKVKGNRVFLPKIGWVCFRSSRAIEGKIKRATVKHKASGWYVSLLCKVTIEKGKHVPITEDNSVGIDLGSIDLVATSRGEKIPNQRRYRKMERKLKRAQRTLSRRKRGSKRYAKAKQRVAVLHEQAANRRRDDLHRISRHLTDENQAVFCEDLNVRGMARGTIGKSVSDAGWGELVRQLKYKAQWAGKVVYQVGRYYPSSKTCAHCDYLYADLRRDERSWTCPHCEMWHDRDLNAAVNIHREGLRLYLAAGQTERQNARGQRVRPARRAALDEARISRF